MNFCKDCKHKEHWLTGGGEPKCRHPKAREPLYPDLDPITGKSISKGRIYCSVMRMFGARERCPYWEHKPRRWWQVWRWGE